MNNIENKGEILICRNDDGSVKLDVKLKNETLCMIQRNMAELFQTTVSNINIHIKNVFEEGELQEEATIKDFLIVRQEGSREVQRKLAFYNLDSMPSTGNKDCHKQKAII